MFFRKKKKTLNIIQKLEHPAKLRRGELQFNELDI